MPQSYNHVVNCNLFSIYQCSFCSLLCLCKLFCFNFLRKRKLLLCCLFTKLLTLGDCCLFSSFFFVLVCLQKKKKSLPCIRALCILEGEIHTANHLHNLFSFFLCTEGRSYLYVLVCKCREPKTILCGSLDC